MSRSLEAKATAPSPADGRDPLPLGRGALEPAVELALRYAAEQDLLPRYLDAEEVWEGLPPEMSVRDSAGWLHLAAKDM